MSRKKTEWLDSPDGEGFFWLRNPETINKDHELTVACVSIYMLGGSRVMFHLIGYQCAFNQDDLLKRSFQNMKWKRIPTP